MCFGPFYFYHCRYGSPPGRAALWGVTLPWVREMEEALAKALEVFEIGFDDFTEEKTVEARAALAIVGAHLGGEPVSLAAAASAAVADGIGTAGLIAEPGGGTGGQLAGLEDNAGAGEVEELVPGATLLQTELEELFEFVLRGLSQGVEIGWQFRAHGLSHQ